MSVDLEAIRRRVQELSGQRRNSNIQLWKPGPGEYKVRGLPWKSAPEGQPFIERWFYYIGNEKGILTPKQFGKQDPIDDLIRKLYQSGRPADRELAKKLQPKMRAYMPIVVRGEESKGVQVWSFGKQIYQKCLGYFLDEEVNDILDPREGYDLKVVVTQQPGKQFQDTVVEAARKSTRLHEDPEQVKKWLESVPNIDDMYRQKSPQEIETTLNNWLDGGSSTDADRDGTARGASSMDELDKLADEVKHAAPAAKHAAGDEAAKAPKRAAKKPSIDMDEEPQTKATKKSLDEAFAELESDEAE